MNNTPIRTCVSSIAVIMILMGAMSCESDPNIMNDDMTETLFVWGYSDVNTGMHRVRIRRAILEEGDMFVHAQDPNLLLPVDPLDVRLFLSARDGQTGEIELEPVNYPKDPGIFSSEENRIHEGYLPISPGDQVQLRITNLNSGEITQSSWVSCIAGRFTYPVWVGWYEPKFIFTSKENPFHIGIQEMGHEVQKFVVEMKYVDVLESGQEICQKAIFQGNDHYPLGTYSLVEWGRTFPVDYLFNIFRLKIPEPAEDIRYRSFYRFSFKSHAGSNSLREFLDNGVKLTDNRRFHFSNITNGYGLFYATHWVQTQNIQPTSSWADTLHTDPDLQYLKFSRYLFDGNYTDPDSTTRKAW